MVIYIKISLKILEESIKDLNQLDFDHLIMIMNFKLPQLKINLIESNRPKFSHLCLFPISFDINANGPSTTSAYCLG
ncbi:hypothetical protein BpHYR1_016269 [Brachionus plicatilis]|uniref:Uncharacterized protein n=1 Tax=Brachionus plicatilis TaxID=10195 RepID=A0A3M7RK83_BRAPC|nr:hypothetical protein BpHYR1_016269 [Brachionus plicatilis]